MFGLLGSVNGALLAVIEVARSAIATRQSSDDAGTLCVSRERLEHVQRVAPINSATRERERAHECVAARLRTGPHSS